MKYKVGDKVRLTPNASWTGLVGKVCVVIEMHHPTSDYICRLKHTSSNWECPMREIEFEKVFELKIGQQLEFAFMGEE